MEQANLLMRGGFGILVAACSLLLLRCISAAWAVSTPESGAGTDSSSADAHVITIVLAGDSGVTDDHGWGRGFAQYLTGDIKCINLSASGRSSKSFRTDGFWDKVLAAKGDYVLINFGGNDQAGKGAARETDPNTTYKANMAKYIDEVRAYGGKPILVAPMTRRFFDKEGKIHSSLQPYVDALKPLAQEKDVPLLDLHGRSIEFCETLGSKQTDTFAPVKNGKLDRSHVNAKGSDAMGALVADELRNKVPELAAYVRKPDIAALLTADSATTAPAD